MAPCQELASSGGFLNCYELNDMKSLGLLLLFCSLPLTVSSHAAEGTYLIVDVVPHEDFEKTLHWLALYSQNTSKMIHLPIGKIVHRINSRHLKGLELHHVDPWKNYKSSELDRKALRLGRFRKYSLRVKKGRINYIGLITIFPNDRQEITWSKSLLDQACRKNPEIFETHFVVGSDAEYKVDCDALVKE